MLLLLLFTVSSLPPLCGTLSTVGGNQTVAAAGSLKCNGKPAEGVKVNLVDLGLGK